MSLMNSEPRLVNPNGNPVKPFTMVSGEWKKPIYIQHAPGSGKSYGLLSLMRGYRPGVALPNGWPERTGAPFFSKITFLKPFHSMQLSSTRSKT